MVGKAGGSNWILLLQEKITPKQKDGWFLLSPAAFCLLVQSKWPDSYFVWKLFLRQWLNIKSQVAKYHNYNNMKTPKFSLLWRMFLLVLVFATLFSWTDDWKKRITCAEINSKAKQMPFTCWIIPDYPYNLFILPSFSAA